jgi:CDP-diacylglycerol--glycerol-3-phosphate 3-phosphatidyltransferase
MLTLAHVPGLTTLLVLAALFASMPVYAALGRQRDLDQDRKGAQLFGGAGDFLIHWAMWVIAPIVNGSLALGLTPDFYNFAGLGLGLVSGVLIGWGSLAAGGWVIAAGGVCDILDGRIARATGVASAYGDFVDSTFDRFVEVFAFLGFVVFFRDRPLGVFVSAAAMAGSLIVSYARARGEVHGVNCSAGLMQRAERLVVTAVACVVDAPVCARMGWRPGSVALGAIGVMAAATFLTAAHRTIWISLRLREAEARR